MPTVQETIKLIRTGENETTEFKRSVSTDFAAEICSLANTEGGVILVGVDDEGDIAGCGKDAEQKISDKIQAVVPVPDVNISSIPIDRKRVVMVRVEKSSKLHSVGNVAYIRVGKNKRPLSIEEVTEKAVESLKVRYDSLPCRVPRSAISKDIVSDYLRRRKRVGTVLESTHSNMKKLRILVKKNGKFYPSNAAVLFFCKTPQDYIPSSGLRIAWFESEEMDVEKDSKEFTGPVWKIVDDVENYMLKNLKLMSAVFVGFKRTGMFEYPIKAIREIVINALIHRNYFIPADVRIFILPNKIIVKNPGSFPPGTTPENPEHIARNPLLCQYMHEWGYIEKYGVGIERVKKICSEHPLASVRFELKQSYTEVIFDKSKKMADIDDIDQKVFGLIKQGKDTSSQIAKAVGLSKVSVVKRISKLETLGLVRKLGKGRSSRYETITR